MTLDDVPADKIMVLTEELDRLFKAAGCKPTCHACRKGILVEREFQILSFYGIDEMLCHKCNREKLEKRRRTEEARKAASDLLRAEHVEKYGLERVELVEKHRRGGTGPRIEGGYSRPSNLT